MPEAEELSKVLKIRPVEYWDKYEKKSTRTATVVMGILGIKKMAKFVHHFGGCHCKAIRFEIMAPEKVVAWSCNCSICAMRKNRHFMVRDEDFILRSGRNDYTSYSFGTLKAKVLFHLS